jgi:hypothetical protein
MGHFGFSVPARALRFSAMAASALLLSACSMASMMGQPGPSATSAAQTANPTAQELSAAATGALPAIATECPPIKVRPGGEALFFYGKGKVGDPHALNYQAVMDKQSRNCIASNGLITVKMGVVGRVLLGPSGSQSKVDVPIRFAVERDGATLYSEKYEIPTQIDASTQSGEFVKVVENVAIPYTGGENITIWVGFDK